MAEHSAGGITRPFLAGVMGWPVAHSRSPLIHNHWLATHAIDGAYVKLAIPANGLQDALRALPALGFAGVNLTIPLKEAALSIVDEINPLARRIGAINTIVVTPDHRLVGRNTDAFGWLESLREAMPGWQAATGPAVVIGAGGAARAILAGLLDEAASDIRLINRTQSRADALAEEFGSPVRALPWAARHAALEGAALLVNTTSQGMSGHEALDLRLDALPRAALVSDIVYVPRETLLLAAAHTRGNPVVNGLGMLLHQARAAFHDWTGTMPAVTPELRALLDATF